MFAVLTWEARPTGLTRRAMTGTRTARAVSTPCEMAQSRSRDGIICSSESSAVRGTGMGQPVRCATTDSSVQSRIAGYSARRRLDRIGFGTPRDLGDPVRVEFVQRVPG
jgi:hypothetical protein